MDPEVIISPEKKGNDTYDNLFRNYIFVSITVETFGSWGATGLKFISEIGRRKKKITRTM